MSLKPYPTYKDSGVAWLGDVPAHWEVTRLKRTCSVMASNVDKKSYDDQEPVRLCNYTDVYYNDRITPALTFMEATASDEQIEKFTLRAGDVIITKDSETADDIGIPAYVPQDLPGVICGYHLSMLRAKGASEGLFIKYLFESDYLKARLEVSANGLTRVGLGQSAIENLGVAMPPQAEQAAIAEFLDRETTKIDDLIAEQEKLIALLAEKRQATISHAVTKGLNPDAPMKDSGVEWLGEIPTHWVATPLKYLALIGNGSTPNRDNVSYWDGGTFPWLNSAVVNQDIIVEAAQFVTELALSECHLPIVRPPAVLVGITGQGRTRGMAATLNLVATINQHVAFIKAKDEMLLTPFLRLAMDMSYARLRFESDEGGSTKGALTCKQLADFHIPLPPLTEQFEAIEFLDTELLKLSHLSDEANRVIDLLKERRTALISAAVTGKIDVRDTVSASEAA